MSTAARRIRRGLARATLTLSLATRVVTGLSAEPESNAALPPGDGRAVLIKNCADCHPIDSVTDKRQSEADWRSSVTRMVSYGVDLTPQEIDQLVGYLAENFGVTPVKR